MGHLKAGKYLLQMQMTMTLNGKRLSADLVLRTPPSVKALASLLISKAKAFPAGSVTALLTKISSCQDH
jgi:hypothetical protein